MVRQSEENFFLQNSDLKKLWITSKAISEKGTLYKSKIM